LIQAMTIPRCDEQAGAAARVAKHRTSNPPCIPGAVLAPHGLISRRTLVISTQRKGGIAVTQRIERRRRLMLAGLAVGLGGRLAEAPRAQVPPSAAEAGAYTGLHAAAWRGDAAALRSSIAAGAALHARDGRGRTPLRVAAHARQREVIRELARAGADLGALDDDRYDAVTIAAVADDEATLAALLDVGASAKRVTSRVDGTALIAAAHLGHDGVVRRLVAAGAPLDHVNNLRWTAVIEAIVLGDGGARRQATLGALLDAGANPNVPAGNGRTPLELARARGHAPMVRLLEQVGAR
jgi:hypothetical protein